MSRYILLFFINVIFWVPISFELTFSWHSKGMLPIGKILDLLFYIPFIVAFIFGYLYSKEIIWKVGVIGLIASIISGIASIWDFEHSIEGGWLEYGSWSGAILVILIQTITPLVLCYLGGWLRLKKHN